ncbi:MAG: patatin-like phospholipase family protein, partial [candidate division Zixibacteria bacterium]
MRKISISLSAALLFSFVNAINSISQSPDDGKITIIFDSSPSELENYLSSSRGEQGIGLVLSGGGSRALAHIGVLKVFDSAGIDINIISGVSMGAIIGGLYSAGYSPEEIENIALSIRWSRLLSQSPVRSSLPPTRKDRTEKSIVKIRFEKWKPVLPKALTTGQNLRQYLETLTARSGIRPSISFDYLNPPLRIVATDLSTGEKVVLSSGSLAEAMRATMAVPLAFTPVEIDGRLLVDGGLVDPIPVDVVREEFAGPVVAVDVSSSLLPASMINDVIDIADQTTTIMSMRKKKEALEKADYVVKPDLPGKLSTDFSDIYSIMEAGEIAARKAIPQIKSLLENNEKTGSPQNGYRITGWKIAGLSSMPMTFFKTVFIHDDRLTSDDILRNLKTAFESGYLTNCWAELTPSDSGYFLEYRLSDNPRIDNIEFTGVTLFSDDNFRIMIETRPGMVLNYNTIFSDRNRLEEMYIRAGYSLARVAAEFDVTGGTLNFIIDEGRINRVLVNGNHETRDWVIRRHIPFSEGDIFTQRRADRGVE